MIRAKALSINEWATRCLEPAYPAIASFAICSALIMCTLNFAVAIGHGVGAAATRAGQFVRVGTWQGPAALPILLCIFFLVLCYELWLRKRTALIILSSVIIIQAVVDIFKGMNPAKGILTMMAGVVLLASMREFPARPDRKSFRHLKILLPALMASFFAYGVVGLYFLRFDLGLGGSRAYALAYRSIQVAAGESDLLFSGWMVVYKDLLILLALAIIVFIGVMLFRPYREAAVSDPLLREKARDIVKRYGSDSLAYFNLRDDKRLYFYGDEMFIAYKLVGDLAIISSDPVGRTDLIPPAIESFKEYCRERGWRVGGVAANGDLLPLYEDAGLKGFHFGDESVLDLSRFTLEGRDVRKLRQSVNKLDKSGVTIEFMFNSSMPTHIRHDLGRISTDWRGGKEETGYSMGLGRLMSSEDPDCLLSVAYDKDMSPIGFMYWVPMYPHLGYSLDIHRSRLDAPGAMSEYIIAKTAAFLGENGYSYLSLHFLAFAQHYREDRTEPGSPFWRNVARVFSRIFPVISVYRFDKKFSPIWKKRMILHQSAVDTLLVGLAIISAESALGVTRPSDRDRKNEPGFATRLKSRLKKK